MAEVRRSVFLGYSERTTKTIWMSQADACTTLADYTGLPHGRVPATDGLLRMRLLLFGLPQPSDLIHTRAALPFLLGVPVANGQESTLGIDH